MQYVHLKNGRMISVCFQGKLFNITVIQEYAPITNAEEAEGDRFYEDLQDFLEHQKKKKRWVIWDWNEKVGSQERPRITGNLALEYKMKQGRG